MRIIVAVTMAVAAVFYLSNTAASDDGWVDLLKGGDLSAWNDLHGGWKAVSDQIKLSNDGTKLIAVNGNQAVVNGDNGNTRDLVSRAEYGDIDVHVEFLIARKSNSGVYLMGRYEIQIYDSFGVEKDKYPGIECGGIYPRWINGQNIEGRSPKVNASLQAGEWQTFDITFRAPRFDGNGKKTSNAVFVKVIHNGKVIHENAELGGPTRGTISEAEVREGALRLQGDHGPVAYRNVRIRKLEAVNSK